MTSIFSRLVIASAVTYTAWFFIPFAWGYLYDYSILDLLVWNSFGSKVNVNGPIPYIVGLVYVASYFGLLSYKPWGRTLFVVLAIFNIVSTPLWGLQVVGTYDASLGYLVSVLDGAIITMAYLTSVSREFSKNA